MGEVFKLSDNSYGCPLLSLQQLHVILVLGNPELDAALQMRFCKSGVEGGNHFP